MGTELRVLGEEKRLTVNANYLKQAVYSVFQTNKMVTSLDKIQYPRITIKFSPKLITRTHFGVLKKMLELVYCHYIER